MFGRDGSWSRAAPLLLAALVMAIVAGCGSDDSGGEGQRGGNAAAGSSGGSSDEARIRRIVVDSAQDFARGDGVAFCSRLVEAEQRDVVAFARNVGRAKTCPAAVASLSEGAPEQTGDNPPKNIVVRIVGDQAAATVKDDGDSAPETLQLVRAGGQWKFVDANFDADPLAAAAEDAKARP